MSYNSKIANGVVPNPIRSSEACGCTGTCMLDCGGACSNDCNSGCKDKCISACAIACSTQCSRVCEVGGGISVIDPQIYM